MQHDDQTIRFKKKLLETMKAFDAFCKEHNLKYVAAYGTLIGTIRHKGLIPWDDDIDVFMDWEDYKRFLSLRSEAANIGYSIIDRENEGYNLPFAKFSNNTTSLWERKHQPVIYGVYIDVFPLGYVDDVNEARKIHKSYLYHQKSYAYGIQRYVCSFEYAKYIITHITRVIKSLVKRLSVNKHLSELHKLEDTISNISKGDYRLYYGSRDSFEHSLFKAEWFSESVTMPFEDLEIPVPVGYHEYLTTSYGDYMTPPPVNKQQPKHSFYYMNLDEGLSLQEVKKRLGM